MASPQKMTATTDGPLTVYIADITRVAGETLQGRVELNMQLAQDDNLEQVRIKFRGSIVTRITTQHGEVVRHHQQTISLFHTKIPLWNRGTYPDPGSHIITCPFEYQLPSTLPASFHCEGHRRAATIGYALEVVGERNGLFRFNRRIRRPISVVPVATPNQLLAKESLMQGWTGNWKTLQREEKLRRGIWGDYAHARVQLTLPKLSSFPISTPIPFSFYVETDTKPMQRDDKDTNRDAPVDKNAKPLFPAPPLRPHEVQFSLHRWAQLRARSYTRSVEDTYQLRGSLGDPDLKAVAAVRQETNAPEWVPAPGAKDEKGRGLWRRGVTFESAVMLPYAPTFQGETVEWQYELHLTVPFPGIGNDLTLKVPIRLDPGNACPPTPPPVGASGSERTMTYADVLPVGPPPMMDLPPAYWAGDNHEWDPDEKN